MWPRVTAAERTTAGTDWAERIAIGGSVVCMMHCLALPLVVAALPALSRALAIPESFHRWILVIALPTASLALIQGRRRHRRPWPLAAGSIGLVLLAGGTFLAPEGIGETVATVIGSVALVTAHVANWRLRHRAVCCGSDGCPVDCT